MDVAGEHDVRRAHARVRRIDALAYTRRVDRKRRRLLENAHALRLGIGRQPERVIERMDVEGVGVVDGGEIAHTGQLFAHPRRGPRLDLSADPAQSLDAPAYSIVIVGLGNVQPPGDWIDA